MTRTGLLLLLLLLAGLLVSAPLVAAQQAAGGVLVRVDGDARLGPNETLEVLVLVGDGSRADIAGTIGTVVVIGGTLNLTGTVLDQVVLVDAHARLQNGSHVGGDVVRTDSTLEQEPGAIIDGEVTRGGFDQVAPVVSLLFGIVFLVGLPLALVVAGLLAVWLFPRQVQKVGRTLTGRLGHTALSAAILWLALPLVAFLLFFTLIGIPLALGILVLFLPLLWLAGFIASGVRVGELILTGGGRRAADRPYLGAVVGILLLLLVGLLPLVGALVVLLAGALGGGAIALSAWRYGRRTRGGRDQPPNATQAVAQDAPWDPGAGGS